jgi:succinate dehydrogenase / fumarate reductase flavoprotein subunit
MNIPHRKFDALIIGAGGAGLNAALRLAAADLRVAVVSKVFPTRSHTVAAQGGVNAALANVLPDDWHWHMFDTVKGSDYLGDQDAIEYMCREAIPTVYELEHAGVPFSRIDDGRIYQRAFGGQSQNFGGDQAARTCAAADRTGHAILHTLYQQNVRARTHFFDEYFAIDLIRDEEGATLGALVLEIETGERLIIEAKATLLATGGHGQVFRTTTNAFINTGDGMAMALRAGVPLMDMEFYQFHPTGVAGKGMLITEGARGEGRVPGQRRRRALHGALRPAGAGPRQPRRRRALHGHRDPRGPRLRPEQRPRHAQARSPRRRGGTSTPAGHYGHLPRVLGHRPGRGHDPGLPHRPLRDGAVSRPTVSGGWWHRRGMDRRRVVPGLYAAGECACVSVHGANRLGGNSLLDILVFGRAAGTDILEYVAEHRNHRPMTEADVEPAVTRLARWDRQGAGESVHEVKGDLRKLMEDHCGVFRDDATMLVGVEKLKALRERVEGVRLKDHSKTFNTARIEALELDNLVDVGMATLMSALHRQESRGAHSRVDYPDRLDEHWMKHSLYSREGDRMDYKPVRTKPLTVESFPPRARVY